MASSDNSSGLMQILVGVFALLAILSMVAAYVGWSERSEVEAQYQEANQVANKAGQDLSRAVANINAAKAKIGYDFEEFGGEAPGPNTVLGKLNDDLAKFGLGEAKPTVTDTLAAMRAELQSRQERIDSLDQDLNRQREELLALQGNYGNRVDEAKESANKSEAELQTNLRDSEEKIAQARADAEKWEQRAQQAEIERETIRTTAIDEREQMQEVIRNLERQLDALGAQIAGITTTSFDQADGKIVRVDAAQRLVYLNLGQLDGLPKQTTFSVYKRNNAGIGRGVEDIKGAIEVTRILGPHFAEAKIVEEKRGEPITSADPIFSPLWEAGRKNYFSFVGSIDVDNDGEDDRDLLGRIIANQGGGVELYVNDEGERVPADASLTVKTKFLVIGDVPIPTDFPTGDERYEKATRIQTERKELVSEARQQGIRQINLNDFLSFIGYKPTQRLFVPGSRTGVENLRTR